MLHIFRRHDVNRIVSGFNHTIAKLEALKEHRTQHHDKINTRIAALSTQRDNLIAEWHQAEVISTNLRSLMGQV